MAKWDVATAPTSCRRRRPDLTSKGQSPSVLGKRFTTRKRSGRVVKFLTFSHGMAPAISKGGVRASHWFLFVENRLPVRLSFAQRLCENRLAGTVEDSGITGWPRPFCFSRCPQTIFSPHGRPLARHFLGYRNDDTETSACCLTDKPLDRKSTRLNSSHSSVSRMPSSA